MSRIIVNYHHYLLKCSLLSCHDYQWSQWLLLLLPSITRQVHVLWVFILRQNEELPYLPASPFASGWHRAVGFCKTTTSLLPRRWDMWRTQLGGYFSSIDMCCQLMSAPWPAYPWTSHGGFIVVDLSLYMVHFFGKPWLKTRDDQGKGYQAITWVITQQL